MPKAYFTGTPRYSKAPIRFASYSSYLRYISIKAIRGSDSANSFYKKSFENAGLNHIDYLPLTGGTLTGLIAGTEANFSGTVSVGAGTVRTPLSGAKLFQLYDRTFLQDMGTAADQTGFLFNTYYDGSWKYATSGTASGIRMIDGSIYFHSASSGSAGNTLPNWDGSDIKMVIASSGTVAVGAGTVRSPVSGAKLFQLNNRTFLQDMGTAALQTGFLFNTYFDGSWKYASLGPASGIRMIDSAIYFHIARSDSMGKPLPNWDGTDIKMLIKSNGYLGLGTTTPQVPLHVHTTGDIRSLIIGHDPQVATNAQRGLEIYTYSDMYIDTKTYAGGSTYFRTGGGAELGSARTWLTVNSATANVGIGTTTPSEKLSVNGNVSAKRLIVTQLGWSDYVFDKDYKLRNLQSLESFITQNKHLPEVPTAKEVALKGISVGDTQALLLKKIEELTLYLIGINKKNEKLEEKIRDFTNRIEALEKFILKK